VLGRGGNLAALDGSIGLVNVGSYEQKQEDTSWNPSAEGGHQREFRSSDCYLYWQDQGRAICRGQTTTTTKAPLTKMTKGFLNNDLTTITR